MAEYPVDVGAFQFQPMSVGAFQATPGPPELVLGLLTPTVSLGQIVSPVAGVSALTGIAAAVVSSTPRSIITVGQWSSLIDFNTGDEWVVTLDGPSANAPRVRIQLLFT